MCSVLVRHLFRAIIAVLPRDLPGDSCSHGGAVDRIQVSRPPGSSMTIAELMMMSDAGSDKSNSGESPAAETAKATETKRVIKIGSQREGHLSLIHI